MLRLKRTYARVFRSQEKDGLQLWQTNMLQGEVFEESALWSLDHVQNMWQSVSKTQ